MQNLGYYQLQANPGLYVLNLAEGRATELYTIVGGEEGPPEEAWTGGQFIAVKSFCDVVKRLMVQKRPGKEGLSLLDDKDTPSTTTTAQEDADKTEKVSCHGFIGITIIIFYLILR